MKKNKYLQRRFSPSQFSPRRGQLESTELLIVEDNDGIPENNNGHNKDENDNKENNQSSNDSSDGSGEEIGGKPKLYGSILKHPGKVIKSFVKILLREKLCFLQHFTPHTLICDNRCGHAV